MSLRFAFTPTTDGGALALSEQKLFGRRAIAPANWPAADGQPLAPALRFLKALLASHRATVSGDTVLVPGADLLAAPPAVLAMLDLPPIAPLSLGLSLRGRIEAPDGWIELRWTDESGRQTQPTRTGLVLNNTGREGRLTLPLARMLDAVAAYNDSVGNAPDIRLQHWVGVQAQLEQISGKAIAADRMLTSFRIYQAGAFALDIRETADGVAVDPIPMSVAMRPSVDDVADAPEDGVDAESEVRNADEHALLPLSLQKAFLDAFNSDGLGTRPAYVLGRSTYMVVDPGLQQALDVVKQVQRAPAPDRRAFVRNPRSALALALPDAGDAVGALFVETRQYSERVTGLGLWQKPVLDWVKRQAGGWLPEAFEVKIGDRVLPMDSTRFTQLAETYDRALAEDQASFSFGAEQLSVAETGAMFDTVQRAVPSVADPAEAGAAADAPPRPVADRDVLLIEENIESSAFAQSIRSRPLFAQKLFPSDLVLTTPKPHQVEGFGWLVESWVAGLPGVLLADDMGLGKTLQALAFLAWVRDNLELGGERTRHLRGPILVVAPTALLRNWQKELATHLGPKGLGQGIEVFGSGLSRIKRRGQPPEDALDIAALREADWVLTTYETLANFHRAFARIGFSIAVFDEMQKIKAPDTINTHAAKTINADFVLGMTGTPIENRIEDLWCIMDRVAPGFLGALKPFSQRYGDGDEQALKDLKTLLDKGVDDVPPIMLRRMKHDHLRGLPQRNFRTYADPAMPAPQAEAYHAIVQAAAGGPGARKLDMLRTIHALRGISLHPLGADGIDTADPRAGAEWIAQSARLQQVMGILADIRLQSEKALVFIEDRAVQAAFAMVAAAILRLDSVPEIINGETPADERQAIVDRFQSRPPGFGLLVLSPKAAGIGLTITAANHVIHLSRWWNPAVEDQCNDRVFRIGQEKPVTVHIPMAVHPAYGDGSFDIKLDALLERKRSLSRDMLAPPISDSDASELFGQTVGAASARQ